MGAAQYAGAVTAAVEQMQEASSELGKARVALEAAVQQRTSPTPAPDSRLFTGMRLASKAVEVVSGMASGS